MVSRFKIEDMVSQDASGVVFRALDTETNQAVAVRRFFPFGVNGGGLSADEQADYDIAVERLTGINHPAMRSIIAGACDPVDGMPFIATEWIEGASLQSVIERGPLTPAEACHMLGQALEVSHNISQVFGEEGVWVETDVHTIIIGEDGSGRGVTFWISPLKWLGKRDGQHGWDSIISLTEDMMGWRGKIIPDHEAGGLGGWLKSLQGGGGRIFLSEAWELLHKAAAVTSTAPVRRVARAPVRVAVTRKPRKKSIWPTLILACVTLAAISFAAWVLIKRNDPEQLAMPVPEPPMEIIENAPPRERRPSIPETAETESWNTPPKTREKTPEQASWDAAEFAAASRKASDEESARSARQNAEIESRNGVFTVKDSNLLLSQSGEEVVLEGTLKGFSKSGTEKTLYLNFSDDPAQLEVRGAIATTNPADDLTQQKLTPLIGKTIRLEGQVKNEANGTYKRPTIKITRRDAIKEIK